MLKYEDYLPTETYTVCAVSTTGQIAYVDRSPGHPALFIRGLTDAQPRQLTNWPDRAVAQVCWHPDGDRIFFTADENGTEAYHLYQVRVSTGDISQVTTGDPSTIFFQESSFSPDGRLLPYCTNQTDPAKVEIWFYDDVTGTVRLALEHDGRVIAGGWSTDGKYLGVQEFIANGLARAGILDIESGKLLTLGANEDGTVFPVKVLDEHRAVLLSNVGRSFGQIVAGQPTLADVEVLAEADWDIEEALVAATSDTMIWITNAGGYSELSAMNLTTREPVPLGALPAGVITHSRLSHDGRYLVVLHSGVGSVPQLFILDVPAGTATQVTDNTTRGGLKPSVAACETVQYPSVDDVTVPAFVYQPTVPSPYGDGSYPVVVSIHGGPHAQELPIYSAYYQMLLDNGIGVVAPNIRGSMGYGTEHMSAIDQNWGVIDIHDFAATHDYVAALPWVRTDRIAVYGRSYGGFASLTCMTRLADRWACGVDLVGVSNLVTFIESVPESWRPAMGRMVGDPVADREKLMQNSPITHAGNIKAPLMVVQGGNDPRVVQAESDQFVEKVRALGIPVQYDLYEDEGHNFSRVENEIECHNNILAFLKQHLLD